MGFGCSFNPEGAAFVPVDASPLDSMVPEDIDASPVIDAAPQIDAPPGIPLEIGDLRLLLHESGEDVMYSWRRTSAGSMWQSDGMTDVLPGDVRFAVNRVARDGSGDEVLAALCDNSGQLMLSIQRASAGGPWQTEWSVDVVGGDRHARGFDIAFEDSGDVLVAYGVGENQLRMREFRAGTWEDEVAVDIGNTGVIVWVELVARPGTDEIAMVFADADQALWLAIWDSSGVNRDTVQQLSNTVKVNPLNLKVQNPVVDLAYEASGQLIAVWGEAGQAGFRMATTEPGAPTNILAAPVLSPDGGVVHALDITPRAGSDEMAIVACDLGDGQERVGAARWDGAASIPGGELDSQINDVNDAAFGDFPCTVAWVGTEAVAIYPDDQEDTIDWLGTTGGVWAAGTDVPVPGKGRTESVLIETLPDGDLAVAAVSDDNDDLYIVTRDASTWQLENDGNPLSRDLSTLDGLPFTLDVRRQ